MWSMCCCFAARASSAALSRSCRSPTAAFCTSTDWDTRGQKALGLHAVHLQLQPVVLRLNGLLLPQLSPQGDHVLLHLAASRRAGRQVLLHALRLVQLALGLLQLLAQRRRLRLQTLHLGRRLRNNEART
ncbi:hypothetical protein EYF80_042248 [Liparis tanakae]|uniref:Secreted protein n=1 Tax=Liparis tanakae TaxID=230148 RepID=A0A4Z2G1Z8_9TELE|nr:hypothetical protein EYF80_042248 [Liparis tanakae]